MVPAIVSGLVAVPWVPLAIASALVEAGRVPLAVASGLVAVPWVPLAHGLACGIHLALGFIRGALGSRCGVVARLVKSMPPGGGSGGVLGPGGGVSGTSSVALGGHGVSGVVCGVSGGLVGMAGGRLGGYLSLGGAGGVGSWAGFAGQLRGLDLEDSCAWVRAAGPGTGSEGDWWPSGGSGDCCCLDLGWGSLNVHSSGGCVETKVAGGWGCRRKPLAGGWAVVPPSGFEQVAGCEGGVGRLFVRWAPGAGRGGTPVELGLAAAAGRGGTPVLGLVGIGLAQGRGWLGGWGLGGSLEKTRLERRERPRKDWALGFGGAGRRHWRLNWGARGCGGGAWIGGARIDGDLHGIRTGWGRILARGCGVGGQQGGHRVWAAVWAAGGLRDVIHGCNVWLPKLWWCWLRSWLGMLSLEFLILVRFKI